MSRYRPPTPQGSKYITPEGAQRLKEELDQLWHDERPRVTAAVAEAAAQGDRAIARMLARSFDLEESDIQVLQWDHLH